MKRAFNYGNCKYSLQNGDDTPESSDQRVTVIVVALCVHFVSLVWLCILFVQMCGSVLASLIGLAGSGYCFIISAMAMLEGPYCLNSLKWGTPFQDHGLQYDTIDPSYPSYINVMLDSVQLLNTFLYLCTSNSQIPA